MSERRVSGRTMALIGVGLGLMVLIAANVHLVYVAVESAPDCVLHAKEADGTGTYRAARSAC